MNNIKKLLLITIFLFGYVSNAYSEGYVCQFCPDGKWSDGKTSTCKDISEFDFNSSDSPYITKNSGSGLIPLPPGCYKIVLAGGGGGFGRSDSYSYSNRGNEIGCSAYGASGGSGYIETYYHCSNFITNMNYTVGNGGSTGYNGGASSISIASLNKSVSASGGPVGGSGSAYCGGWHYSSKYKYDVCLYCTSSHGVRSYGGDANNVGGNGYLKIYKTYL